MSRAVTLSIVTMLKSIPNNGAKSILTSVDVQVVDK